MKIFHCHYQKLKFFKLAHIRNFIFLSIIISTFSACNQVTKTKAVVQNGTLDLSTYDPAGVGVLEVEKNWAFYWNRFVTCEEFLSEKSPKPDIYVNVDKSWNDFEINGEKLPGSGFATYAMKIENYGQGLLTLHLKIVSTAYSIYLNSEKLGQVGNPGNSLTHSPQFKYKRFTLDLSKSPSCLVIHVSNFSSRAGGIWNPIYLGSDDHISQLIAFNDRIQIITSSIFFIIGLYHFILYFYQRNRRYILYFALLSLSILFRQLSTDGRILEEIFVWIGWKFLVKIEYGSMLIGIYIMLLYIMHFFQRNIFFLRIVLLVPLTLFISLILFTEPILFTQYLSIYQLYIFVVLLAYIYIIIESFIKKREFSFYMLIVSLLPVLFIIIDLLSTRNVIYMKYYLAPWGMVIFIFGQAYIVSVRFSQAFLKVKVLSESLEVKTAELKKSNDTIVELNSLLNSLNEVLTLESVMEKIMGYIEPKYGLSYFILGMLSPDGVNGRLVQARFPSRITPMDREIIFSQTPRIKGGRGAHSYAFRSREPLYFSRIRVRGTAEAEKVIIEKLGIKSFLIVPLIVQNEIVGILDLWRDGEFQLQKEEITQISILGEQLAGIIQNSILLERFEKEKEAARKAYLDLEASQKQLVQSDRMITLGTMMAGIVHEINSPLGAIKSNSENIQFDLNIVIQNLPDLISETPTKTSNYFLSILENLKEIPERQLSSREQRALRKKLASEFDNLANAEEMAEKFMELGLDSRVETFKSIMGEPEFLQAMDLAGKLNGILKKAGVIEFSATRVSKIVKSLKSFMHFQEKDEMILSDLGEGLETVLIILHNQLKQGIEVIKDYDEVPNIYCYPDELNQIWTNLINNSIQAMKGEGKIKIELQNKGKEILVAIEDNGPGIPIEIQEKIFQPFFTTKPAGEGSGLGLHIIQKILDKHKGRIQLESEAGKTRFSVFLPARLQPETKVDE